MFHVFFVPVNLYIVQMYVHMYTCVYMIVYSCYTRTKCIIVMYIVYVHVHVVYTMYLHVHVVHVVL